MEPVGYHETVSFLRYAGVGGMAFGQSLLDKAFPNPKVRYDESQIASRDSFLKYLEDECIALDLGSVPN